MRRPARARLLEILLVVLAVPIVPASAQQPQPPQQVTFDLTGEWGMRQHEDQPERGPGPELGDYLGLPINEAARRKADSWDASILTLPEHQCKPHPSTYALRGPQNLRIWKEIDPQTQRVIAIGTHGSWMSPIRMIWLDGRPHPPDYAAHTFMGFSTGTWEGDVLIVTTTHIKQGWIRRNGVPQSDRVTTTERFTRHGDMLTYVIYIHDPDYLAEPIARSRNFARMSGLNEGNWIAATPCEPGEETAGPLHQVPHYPIGENPFVGEQAKQSGVPVEALMGGRETTYPEYRQRLPRTPK